MRAAFGGFIPRNSRDSVTQTNAIACRMPNSDEETVPNTGELNSSVEKVPSVEKEASKRFQERMALGFCARGVGGSVSGDHQ